MEKIDWGAGQVNSFFTVDVIRERRAEYSAAVKKSKSLEAFLHSIGMISGPHGDTAVARHLHRWPADQKKLFLKVVDFALTGGYGIVVGFCSSTDGSFRVLFPEAWDGDYIPVYFVGNLGEMRAAEPKGSADAATGG